MSAEAAQPPTKFIGKADIPLDHGLGSLPSLETSPEALLQNDGTPDMDIDGSVIKRFYRASLYLRDYITNIFIALVLQMSLTTNITSGSFKIATKLIEGDNNGVKNVLPELDKGICCTCTGRQCSIYDVCKRRCPNAVHRGRNGVPTVTESDEERTLETNQLMMRQINKKSAERRANTRQINSRYWHLLTEEFSPLVYRLIETQKLSLNRLKRWIITMCPNLRSLYQEEDVDVVLNSFYPPWYDTHWLMTLTDRLEQHLGTDLEIKKSLHKFNLSVDHYFSNRAFVKGVGVDGELVAMISIDLEWQRYRAHDLHLIYGRAVRALEQISCRSFTVLFCTVLKEYVIEHKINNAVVRFQEAIIEDVKCDNHFESSAESGFSSCLEEACFSNTAAMLVVGEEFGIAIPDLEEGCGCSLFETYTKPESAALAGCFKPFKGYYGP